MGIFRIIIMIWLAIKFIIALTKRNEERTIGDYIVLVLGSLIILFFIFYSLFL
jgi:hypothetical protein